WESKNWSPLEHPLVKINFDAALWESDNRSSSGIVIREKDGQFSYSPRSSIGVAHLLATEDLKVGNSGACEMRFWSLPEKQ
ncbi:hypothetical protein Gorai_021418, partial [Gossypium raimondii]|nr:hypothetical protein [Gossypium raimondii]